MTEHVSAAHLLVLVPVIVLIVAIIWSIVRIVRNRDMPVSQKLVWTIVLIAFPVLGLLIWIGYSLIVRSRRPRSDL